MKDAFLEDGYGVVENLLSPAEVEAAKAALSGFVRTYGNDRERAELIPGKDGSQYSGARIRKHNSDFFFQLEAGQEPRTDDAEALESQVRKFMCFEDEHPVFREMLGPESPMARIVGELLEDTPLLFQCMALIKPARIGSTKPWHQDNAYFAVSPLEAVCGVWIALDEATVQNGCMHMLRGGHKAGPLLHEHRRDCEIHVSRLDLKTLDPVPLKPGSALFFSGMVPHQTPPNRSDHRRRALQFHFRGSRSTLLPGPEYDTVFRDHEGRPASCEAIRRLGI